MASSVFIGGNSAAAVALFSHNIWAASSSQSTVSGAVNYIAPAGVLNDSYYLNAAQWNASSNVQDDRFEQITINAGSGNLQAAIDGQMAGAILPATLS